MAMLAFDVRQPWTASTGGLSQGSALGTAACYVSDMDLLDLGTATLGECGAVPLAGLRPVWPGAAVAGPAFTVRCPAADNLAVHVGVAEAPAGSVLVVAVDGQRELGWWGEVLTTGAEARGVAGLVIDACVRDTAALEAHRFPVFATGVALPGTAKDGGGAVGGSVVCAGATVASGDWMAGDADGVVAVPARTHDEVVAAGRARQAKEARFFTELRAGRTTLELLGLDASKVARS